MHNWVHICKYITERNNSNNNQANSLLTAQLADILSVLDKNKPASSILLLQPHKGLPQVILINYNYSIPAEYADITDAFSKIKSEILQPHRPINYGFKL